MLVYDDQTDCMGDDVMTHFEASNFLIGLIKEIMKQCKNMAEAKNRSELFTLYCLHLDLAQNNKTVYKRCNVNKNETTEIMFYDFLNILYSIKYATPLNDDQLENAKEFIQSSSINDVLQSNNNSNMLKQLFKHLKYKKRYSLKALIYGLKCKGRGFEKRVTDIYNQDERIRYVNDLKRFYNNEKEISSWCKFRFSRSLINYNTMTNDENYNVSNPDKSYYGQLNFFMKLDIPSENILHGLKISSVTAISNHTTSYLWNFHSNYDPSSSYKSRTEIDCFDFNKVDNIFHNALFIPFTDIFATKYGVIYVDNAEKPVLNEDNHRVIKSKDLNKIIVSNVSTQNNVSCISKMYFIALHPERCNIVFNAENNNEMYNS
jgi:hypothetical protein